MPTDIGPSPLLLIDDDAELCQLLGKSLKPEGFNVEAVHDGNLGARRALSGDHTLVILDVMLPLLGGFDVLRRIRATSSIPVIMLTAKDSEMDRVFGLESGADDYLPKPFGTRELVARVRAVLRRLSPKKPARRMVVGDLEIDAGARMVRRGERIIPLTSMEFDVLVVLMQSAGEVATREALYEAVLGRRLMGDDRSIDMHVSHLRRKIGDGGDGQALIKTVRGAGYILARPAGPHEAD